jgi:hypothetical protein
MIAARYPEGAWYLAAVREANATTARGGRVRVSWSSAWLDAEGWRAEFRAALDRRLTARMPVASSSRACRCRHCTARCGCSSIAPSEIRRVPVPIVTLCGRCTRGHKQGEDYQRAILQDCRDVRDHATRRIIVRQFRTVEIRARFGQYLYTKEG